MTPELTYLFYAVILLIAHVFAQATLSALSKGLGWALGPQDDDRDQHLYADRLQKALRNYLETFPAFAALALILAVTDSGTSGTALGAALYFWGRVAYIPCRLSGLPLVRSIAWFTAIGGIVMMMLPLFSAG